jgi:hypothetical protein
MHDHTVQRIEESAQAKADSLKNLVVPIEEEERSNAKVA